MKRRYLVMMLASVLSVMLAGCSGADESSAPATQMLNLAESADIVSEAAVADAATAESGDIEWELDEADAMTSGEELGVLFEGINILSAEESGRLLSYNVDFSLETVAFMEGISQLWAEIGRVNGYVEHERISGRTLRNETDERTAHFEIRIPNGALATFIEFVAREYNVLSYRRDMIDFTFTYEGNEGLADDLRDIETQLLEELEDEENRNARRTTNELRDIRAHMRRLEQENRQIQRDVNYSIVSIRLQEVMIREPLPTPEPPTFGERLRDSTTTSLLFLGDVLQFLFIALLTLLPWALLIGSIVALFVPLGRKMKKRKIEKHRQLYAAFHEKKEQPEEKEDFLNKMT